MQIIGVRAIEKIETFLLSSSPVQLTFQHSLIALIVCHSVLRILWFLRAIKIANLMCAQTSWHWQSSDGRLKFEHFSNKIWKNNDFSVSSCVFEVCESAARFFEGARFFRWSRDILHSKYQNRAFFFCKRFLCAKLFFSISHVHLHEEFKVFKTQESLEKLKIRSSSRQCSSCAKYPTELHKRWNRKFCFSLLCLFSLLAHTLVHFQLWTGSKDYWKSWTAGNFHFHVRTFVFSDTLIRSLQQLV